MNSEKCLGVFSMNYFFFFFGTDHGLERLVQAYRAHGHKAAKINPLLPETPVTDGVPEIAVLDSLITGRLNTSGKPDNTW